VRLDGAAGTLEALVPRVEWAAREVAQMPAAPKVANSHGVGRELFAAFRRNALAAEEGACTWL
jgi:phosphogluconate dehydratase